MWRRLIILIAILGGLLAGVVMGLKSDRVGRQIKERLEVLAYNRFGVEVDINDLEVELLPPGIVVHDVAAYHLEVPDLVGPSPLDASFLRLERGRLVLRPWPAADGSVVVHHLALEGLRGELDPRQLVDELSRQDGSAGLPLDIRELLLRRVDLVLNHGADAVTVRGVEFSLQPSTIGRRELSLSIERGSASLGGRQVAFEIHGQAELAGTLNRPRVLNIETLIARVGRAGLQVRGALALEGAPSADLQLEGSANLSTLTELRPHWPALKGQADWTSTVEGSLSEHTVRVRARVANLALGARYLGNVEMDASLRGDRIGLEAFRIEHPRVGTLTGSGTLDLTSALAVTFSTRLRRVSLPHLLDLAGMADTWVRLFVGADVRGRGTLSPLRLEGSIDGDVEHFTVLDGSYRDRLSEKVMGFDQASLKGAWALTPSSVSVWDMAVGRLETALDVEASFSFDEEIGFALRAYGQSAGLADVGPIAGIHFSGRGPIAATVEGPYGEQTVSGTVEIEDFSVDDYPIGSTKATLVFSDLVLRVERVSSRHGRGSVSGSGRFDFAGESPFVAGDLQLRRMPLGQILASARLDASLSERFAGPVSGRVMIAEGPLLRPQGRVEVGTRALLVDGVDLGRAALRGGFGEPQRMVWADLVLRPAKGEAKLSLVVKPGGELAIAGEIVEMPLELTAGIAEGAELKGSATGSLRLHGPSNALSGEIAAQVDRLSLVGLELGASQAVATLRKGRMEVSGTVLARQGRLSGTLALGERLPYAVTLTFAGVEGTQVWPVDMPWRAKVGGSLFCQGDLSRPETIIADIDFETTEAFLDKLRLRSTRSWRLQYGGGFIKVTDLALRGSGVQLTGAGRFPTDGDRVRLQIAAEGDLTALRVLVPEAEFPGGRFGLRLAATGQLDSPDLDGEATIRSGSVRLDGLGITLADLDTTVIFQGRTVRVGPGSATAGRGRVRFSGQILLPPEEPARVNLQADVTSLRLRPAPDLELTTSGNLALEGPWGDLQLKGGLKLHSLRYTADLGLQDLIPGYRAPPLGSAGAGQGEVVHLAVRVKAANDLLLSSNVLEAELQTDLMVTGTSDRIGLMGSVTPLWATARYQGNVFELERANIMFTDEFRIHTRFDLHASTKACGMNVGVDVQGSSSQGYEVMFSGVDESGAVDNSDVLSCLQFGLRLSEVAGRGAGDIEGSLLPSGLDALWTVTGMDEKVRRLLPLPVVDELKLTSGWSARSKRTTPRLLLRKELGEGLRLTYSRALDVDEDQVASLEYRLANMATLEATLSRAEYVRASFDLGLDLSLHWEFD